MKQKFIFALLFNRIEIDYKKITPLLLQFP